MTYPDDYGFWDDHDYESPDCWCGTDHRVPLKREWFIELVETGSCSRMAWQLGDTTQHHAMTFARNVAKRWNTRATCTPIRRST
jgi:hypothetical protein